MKTMFYKLFALLIIISLVVACNNKANQEQDQELNPKAYEEPLVKANKQAVQTEDEQIESFVQRYKWDMKSTGSGLRYAIYKKGSGPKAETGKIAVLKYSVKLITGEEIYSSKTDGMKEFLIGKGGVESGLEEGILLLRVGDHAKFIIPSHLGFGLLGDQNKVPPKSTLIYDLELIALK
ncbi:MAG: FKBP-type peptidyl-prolyl cis-trans isomerase [Lentimicrobiaceae bacterium]